MPNVFYDWGFIEYTAAIICMPFLFIAHLVGAI